MVDREVFDRRLAKLEELLRRLRSPSLQDWDRFQADETLQASTERWLQLASECALDLAHHLIADRGWKTPTTYREAFLVLAHEGVLTSKDAAAMEAWAGLRNVLVHLYLDVDQRRIFEIIARDLSELEDFAKAVSRAVAEDETAP